MSIHETNDELPIVILAQLVETNFPIVATANIEPIEVLSELRGNSDAVIIGVNKAMTDAMDWLFEEPEVVDGSILVILDGQGIISTDAKILQEAALRHLVIATTRQMPPEKREYLNDLPYSDVWVLPAEENGAPDILFLLSILGKHEFAQVLVEDNALAESFLRLRPSSNAPLANQVRFFDVSK